LLATDAAEALVREGMPFRDAHEQVAEEVRAGTWEPETTAAESVSARLDVRSAVVAARARFAG
jgi:argininosuccinate lyase